MKTNPNSSSTGTSFKIKNLVCFDILSDESDKKSSRFDPPNFLFFLRGGAFHNQICKAFRSNGCVKMSRIKRETD